ncbi:MAG: translational GTPase TypA [Culicoidibacterales bacterium]
MNQNIRNIAIIAHVDHGKTTLVDALLRQSNIFHEKEQVSERVMDSNDLEKERGITILSKNTAIRYQDVKINIVDTPGHADFGGEVERVLKMVDSVLLVVDAFEGAMPQTRFVLKKALELGLRPIVVVNKIDRPDARPDDVVNEVFDLFVELGASDEQLDFKIIYASAKNGIAKYEVEDESENLEPLFQTIIEHAQMPSGEAAEPAQMLISTIDADPYLGRLIVGKVARGTLSKGMALTKIANMTEMANVRIGTLYTYEGLGRVEIDKAEVGDIIAIRGIDANIGDTLADAANPEPIETPAIDEPTISMNFMVNDSPFAGQEGKYVTSRHIKDRLTKELETNVSLRVEEVAPDTMKVSGRGELHLSILIETMRREGYELQVSKPTVIVKEINGKMMEPFERVFVDVPEDFVGAVINMLSTRKGEMTTMKESVNGYARLEYVIPSRGLIGFRNEFLTETKGNGIINSYVEDYMPFKGEIDTRSRGSLVSSDNGVATAYAIMSAQDRGVIFIQPGTKVYDGMIIGMNAKQADLEINICKAKQLTNVRSSGTDNATTINVVNELSLEESLDFIGNDEYVEVTPESIRMRKKYLDPSIRRRVSKYGEAAMLEKMANNTFSF